VNHRVCFISLLLSVTYLLSMASKPASAWGTEGHSVIAEIAQRHLTTAASAQIKGILGSDASLASLSSWADDYRALHFDTSGWHFVDIPLDSPTYDETRDCAPSTRGDCIIHEISRALRDLGDQTLPSIERRDALKFIVHFVGDVNQPLHTVKEFTGYNDMEVCYFSTPAKNDCAPTNLHAVWDSGLIRSIFYDWGAYVEYLEVDWMPRQDLAAISAGNPVDWALEAHKAAHDIVIPGINMNDHLGDEYLVKVRPTLDRQLGVAGLRLARLLNEVLR
jgi:nuclease S1